MVTVGTTVVPLVVSNPNRKNLILSVSSSGTVYLDPLEEVLTDNTANAKLALTTSVLINLKGYVGPLSAIGSAASQVVHVWETE